MAALVTDRFRIYNAKTFQKQVTDENLYLFIGRTQPWQSNVEEPNIGEENSDDNYPPIPLDTANQTGYNHWESMIAAKKINESDLSYVIPRHDWESGTEWKAYSANDKLLTSTTPPMVATVYDESDEQYRVFKCITAGTGTSDLPPSKDAENETDSISEPGDGYVWKFMYRLSANDVLKFLTPEHVPVGNAGVYGNSTEYANPNTTDTDATNPVDETGNPGHAQDLIRELGAYYVGINTKLTYDESGAFTTQNDFRQIGLLMNPLDSAGNPANNSHYRQTQKLVLNEAITGGDFRVDEIVQDTTGNKARVIQRRDEDNAGVTEKVMYVQMLQGDVSFTNEAISNETGVQGTISSNEPSQMKRYTGDVLYIENRKPIPRAPDQTESLTIILEF